MAKRLQRKRRPGWRKPAGAICVDRTSRYGNPFKASDYVLEGRASASAQGKAVEAFQRWILTGYPISPFGKDLRLHRAKLINSLGELVGCDLLCYCDERDPCHGNSLLKMAEAIRRGREVLPGGEIGERAWYSVLPEERTESQKAQKLQSDAIHKRVKTYQKKGEAE